MSASASASASAPADVPGAALGGAASRLATPNPGGVGGEGGGGGGSHFEQPGSAWQNVHAKGKLRLLLAGLVSDYGVKELLSDHHIVGVRIHDVTPTFLLF